MHLPYESESRWGPWAFRIDTGHRTRAFVLAAGFFKLVDRLTWLTSITMADALRVFTISNRYSHLYLSCNDGHFFFNILSISTIEISVTSGTSH